MALDDVDVVGSHGQTVWHVPTPEELRGSDRRSRSALQIGDGSVIAHRTGTTAVPDFRTRDVAAGGHGAPLAPVFDLACLSAADEARALQNDERFAEPYPHRIVVSGGGANNPTLLSMLEEHADSPVERSDAHGIDPDAKEAALFALLGVTAIEGVPNNVPSATGADSAVTLGKISRP